MNLCKKRSLPEGMGQAAANAWFSRCIAAPSWVITGGVRENCQFLAGRVDEIGLLFFESASSLSYTGKDLPHELRELPVSWHVHLPLDLPWRDESGADSAAVCLALMEKLNFLHVTRAVLHPPALAKTVPGAWAEATIQAACRRLEGFAALWRQAGRSPGDLMLENTKDNDLLACAACSSALGYSVCLDFGHMLAYDQLYLCDAFDRLGNIAMIHWNAPGSSSAEGARGASRHLPLTALSAEQHEHARRLCRAMPPTTVHMLELFTWQDCVASIPLVADWLAETDEVPHDVFPQNS